MRRPIICTFLLVAALAAALARPAAGAGTFTFTPHNDETPIARLSTGPTDTARWLTIHGLREARAASADDPQIAGELARLYLEEAQHSGDKRLVGHAAAVLAAWDGVQRAPPAIAFARAIIRQHEHRFDEALADLDTALATNPRNAQMAAAHRPSDSHLYLDLSSPPYSGRWDIALQDFELAVGIDADRDGSVTWGELRARHRAIADHALSRLTLIAAGTTCRLDPAEQQVARRSDGVYAVLNFSIACPNGGRPDTVDYRLLFELDTSHRGLLHVNADGAAGTLVLSPDAARAAIGPGQLDAWRAFRSYWRKRVHHIWIGLDHVLFLLTLLLPAVLWREGRNWRPAPRFPAARSTWLPP